LKVKLKTQKRKFKIKKLRSVDLLVILLRGNLLWLRLDKVLEKSSR